jgi:septum site-determining protein MinC
VTFDVSMLGRSLVLPVVDLEPGSHAVTTIRGDARVLGSVASGAEIIASGSVHVYGALRGRAIAGATGNAEARIFCRRNEAELLAVDGWYRTADDMDPASRGKPIQAFLENGTIWVATLD